MEIEASEIEAAIGAAGGVEAAVATLEKSCVAPPATPRPVQYAGPH